MLGSPGARRRLPRAMHSRDFALFVIAVLAMTLAEQMLAVAIGWQVYSIHHRAFDLGLIGLLEFAPVFLLAIPAGTLVDRVSRRLVLALSAALLVAISAALIAVSAAGAHALWPFLTLALVVGVATALSFPATRALTPALVERELLPSALAVRSVVSQTGVVAGPALGGLLFALSPETAYAVALAMFCVAAAGILAMRPQAATEPAIRPEVSVGALLGGIRFIRATPILLGAILLDLFAVLFGGAVALLPVFAQSILHTGPVGLGVLRSAPAVGAVFSGVWLVRRPLPSRAGPTLIAVVIAFGASMVVFGLSRSLPLSLAALAFSGAVDMVSMNIRATTATLVTPDHVRGRVGSVEAVFIGASNELGAFESGTAAALLGAVPAVVAGGGLTIVIALAWLALFPELATLGRMSDLRPVSNEADDPERVSVTATADGVASP
ncbi:MAG: MFS transporter [Solirubrobacteraceae bacterium]|jgi:MFS family permease